MGLWDWVKDTAKALPGVGHVIAAVQAATGDTEGARRTVASATGNLITTVATVAGALAGPAGAAAAGAAGSVVGNMVEHGINGEHIETNLGQIALQAATGAASGLTGGGAGALIGGTTKVAGQTVTRTVLGAAASTTIAQSVDAVNKGKDARDRSADHGPGTEEGQKRVVGPQTAAKAREFEKYYADQLRDPLLGKLDKLEGSGASLGDLVGNTTNISFGFLEVDKDWNKANEAWQDDMKKWTTAELKERILTTDKALEVAKTKKGVKITLAQIEAKLAEVDDKRKAVTKTLNDEFVYKDLAKSVPSSLPAQAKPT